MLTYPRRQARCRRARTEPANLIEPLEVRALLSWAPVPGLLTARSELAATVGPDGRIYALGGADANSNPLTTNEAYTVGTNGWALLLTRENVSRSSISERMRLAAFCMRSR